MSNSSLTSLEKTDNEIKQDESLSSAFSSQIWSNQPTTNSDSRLEKLRTLRQTRTTQNLSLESREHFPPISRDTRRNFKERRSNDNSHALTSAPFFPQRFPPHLQYRNNNDECLVFTQRHPVNGTRLSPINCDENGKHLIDIKERLICMDCIQIRFSPLPLPI